MSRQFEIIDEIAGFLLNASEEDYEKLVIEVELMDIHEGWTRESLWKSVDGNIEYLSMDAEDDPKMSGLVRELYDEMKKHTGGELAKFSIEIDEEGTARCKFAYSNEPPQPS